MGHKRGQWYVHDACIVAAVVGEKAHLRLKASTGDIPFHQLEATSNSE